ncbi:MAG: GreA/GreB family elongation factor [Burkholderiales bacterium]
MTYKPDTEVVLSTHDAEALALMLGESGPRLRASDEALAALVEKLQTAEIAPDGVVLEDRIIMNACIRYVEAGTREGEITLTWPSAAMPERGMISVVSPMGAALLGRRVGDEVVVALPYGAHRVLTITGVRDIRVKAPPSGLEEECARDAVRPIREPVTGAAAGTRILQARLLRQQA